MNENHKTIKICFPFNGDTIGGSHKSSLLLIKELQKYEHIEPIIVIFKKGLLANYLDYKEFRYQVIKSSYLPSPAKKDVPRSKLLSKLKNYLITCEQILKAAWFLRKNEIDLVHTNDNNMHLNFALAATITGTKHIMHIRSIYKKEKTPFSFDNADKIISISQTVCSSFPQCLREKNVIIDNPFEKFMTIDKGAAKQQLCNELGIDKNVPIVLMPSNFTKRKRPDFFAKIFVALKKRFSVFFAFIAAGTDYEGFWLDIKKEVQSNDNTQQFFYLGFRKDVEQLISAADIVCAPAVAEPFGRTLVEAMMLKTPVVAAADAGHVGIISHNETGFLIPPDDIDGFVLQIKELLENTEKAKQVAANAFQYAHDRFSIEKHCQCVLSIYDDLLLPEDSPGSGITDE